MRGLVTDVGDGYLAGRRLQHSFLLRARHRKRVERLSIPRGAATFPQRHAKEQALFRSLQDPRLLPVPISAAARLPDPSEFQTGADSSASVQAAPAAASSRFAVVGSRRRASCFCSVGVTETSSPLYRLLLRSVGDDAGGGHGDAVSRLPAAGLLSPSGRDLRLRLAETVGQLLGVKWDWRRPFTAQYLNTATNALLTVNASANCLVYCFSGRRYASFRRA